MLVHVGKLNFNEPTPLCEIMGRNGSDKGGVEILKTWHTYTVVYNDLFASLRDKPLRVFELGLGTNDTSFACNMGEKGVPGASLRGWCEYMPHARVYGADIDRGCLFETDRIKTYYCDQLDPAVIADMWSHADLADPFDILIDDGLHRFDSNVCFLENSLHKLAVNGIYVIEDSGSIERPRMMEKIREWAVKYPNFTFQYVPVPSVRNYSDNNLILARRNA